MLSALKRQVADGLAAAIRELWDIEHEPIVEVPPRRDLGDLAFPGALQLARAVRRPPRQIAEAIAAAYRPPELVARVEVAGAGYLNFFLDRSAVAARLLAEPVMVAPTGPDAAAAGEKVIVEHTNINPNKAAHIGHLRNAVLGDVLVRVLRALGHPVEVQNYVDDTGVQLADVVVGFVDLRGIARDEIAALPEPFDYLCWDLYSQVGRWYEEDPEQREGRRERRRETLHELEIGRGERAAIGRLVARRILHRHLATMARVGIGYDLLTRESDVLGERFFELAFGRLKDAGAVRLEKDGKNAGCWVMPLTETEEFAGLEDPDKVIVRSDGTVTYVGKDIAYQLWKFGLLGRDFHYRLWPEEGVWETAPADAPGATADHPPFGGAARVVNVIDARQSYLQKIVRAGLEALGHGAEAERSVHFAYEMVALSAATARALGYVGGGEEEAAEAALGEEAGEGGAPEAAGEAPPAGARPAAGKALEMSGRKGIGVKADDLLDQLVAKAGEEVAKRNRELAGDDLAALARDIATAALRFLMVRATTTRVIAFDLDEALEFEGETGPYLQYSSVRPRNIRRRLAAAGLADEVAPDEAAALPAAAWGDDLWHLVLGVAEAPEVVARAGASLELSLVARHALELAQRFNALYHRHPILQEEDRDLRTARLAAVRVYQRGLEALADLLGIPLPERM